MEQPMERTMGKNEPCQCKPPSFKERLRYKFRMFMYHFKQAAITVLCVAIGVVLGNFITLLLIK